MTKYDVASITFYNKKGDIVDVISCIYSVEFITKNRLLVTYDNGNIEIFRIKKFDRIFIQV